MMALLQVGCVGTIKDANSISTKSSAIPSSLVGNYPGIQSVTAIADSKVEVFFPSVEGDLEKIAYVIRYSSQQVPVYIQASVLKEVEHFINGEKVYSLKATISNLRSDTSYDFSVEVRDIVTGSESSNNVYMPVKTFSNLTARFTGVGEVNNLPGVNGINGIEVNWVEAEVRGTSISKNDIDPIGYEITVLDGSTPDLYRSPAEMNNKTLSTATRTVYSAPAGTRSYTINGLRAFTKYYVQVRAIHYGKSLNVTNVNYKVEENTDYKEIITYDPSSTSSISDPTSFASSYPPGPTGLTSINLSWKRASGVFDHYRIYYNIGDFTPVVSPICLTNCVVVNSSQNLYQLVGVSARQNYYLSLVVCQDVSCSSYISYNKINHLTSPPVITSYAGIYSIDTAKNLGTLDKFFLNMALPDFNLGYIAGVDIFGCHSTSMANCNPSNVSFLLSTTTALAIDPAYDYTSNNILQISGIEPSSPYSYCFYSKPYIYNDLNAKTYVDAPLSTVRCQVPEIKAPSFSGFDIDSTCDLLKWQTPTTGVFDGFEIYYRLKSSVYEGSVPLNITDGTYQRFIVNADITEYSTQQLALVTGGAYDFGIRTIYRSADGQAYWLRSNNVSTDKLVKCPMSN